MNAYLKKNGVFSAALLISLGLALPQARAAADVTCDGCVDTTDIADNAVNSNKIKKNTIQEKDLHKSAKPAGADFEQTLDDTPISPTGADVIIHSVTIKAPGPGTVIATGNFYADYGGALGAFACTVTHAESIGGNYIRGEAEQGSTPVSRTSAFLISKSGNFTVNLVCRELAGDVTIMNPTLAAWFVPGRY